MKKFKLFKLLLLGVVLITSNLQMLGYDLTFRCIPKEIWGDYWVEGTNRLKCYVQDGNNSYKWNEMTYEGNDYNGYRIYSTKITDFPSDGAKNIKFQRMNSSYVYEYEISWGDWRSGSSICGEIRTSSGWVTYRIDHTIAASSTIVWDMAGNESRWSASYIYRDVNGASGSNDAMTRIGSTTQWYKTYNSASTKIASIQFRSNTSNWDSYSHTTNIDRNISGVTLFTNLNTSTDTDPRRLNWQITENAKKATSGVKIYFDNTAAGWSKVRLKYGTAWFNRSSASDATKVSGTDNLYVIEIPNDVYYEKYYLADHYGYTNYNSIENMSDISNRINYQASNLSSDITYIPSTGSGAGTAGNPKVWTTTTISGHTRKVTIGSHAHGTITVSYTNESNIASSSTSTLDVAQTCIVSASATADNGYDFSSMTKGGAAYTPGTSHIVRADVTFAATFTAHTYGITLNKGDHGAANQSATVDFDATGLKSVTHVSANAGYQLEGYYDGSTKVLNANGSFAADNVTGYITGGKWSKYDADATLTAKFSPVALTFEGDEDGHETEWDYAGNWSPACVPTIAHDVVLTAPVEVNIAHAVAKSVVIDTMSSNTGKLTVQANKGLEVAGTIKLKNNSGSLVATSAKNIVLESSASGNATLIFDNSTMKDSATVCLYSKGWTEGTQGGGDWNWQYVGIPVTNATRLNDYYGGYMYEWNTSTRGWDDVKNTSATLTTFKAYSVSYPTDEGNLHTYEIDGELAATTNHTISVDAGQTVQAAANSWTAPIRIKDITYTNWTPATIFIFNTGYGEAEKATVVGQRYTAGTYLPIPVSSAPYLGESYIAPMQGFLFKNTRGSDATITLSYADAVRTDGSGEIVAGPMHAPARYEDGIVEPVVLKIYVCGTENDDRVVLLERSDFSREFDNGWDGEKFQVNAVKTAPRIFAINATGGKEAVSAIPEFDGTVIGFRPGTDDSYKISFEYNGGDMLYLKDTKNNILTLINNESEYEFYSNGENEDARFLIYKAPAVTTGVSETGVDAIAHKQMIDGVLYIIRNGQIYSTDGQIVK